MFKIHHTKPPTFHPITEKETKTQKAIPSLSEFQAQPGLETYSISIVAHALPGPSLQTLTFRYKGLCHSREWEAAEGF